MPYYYAVVQPTGEVRGFSATAEAMPTDYYTEMNAVDITESQYAAMQAGGLWKLIGGVLTAVPDADWLVGPARDAALVKIDADAETIRLRYLTDGSGQALEYQGTFDDANKMSAAPDPVDPADYPWLVSEQSAQAAAGVAMSLRDVCNLVLAQSAAWVTVGAAIKETRRAAKIKVAAAADVPAVNAIMAAIVWPS